jgi:hypothetical protein
MSDENSFEVVMRLTKNQFGKSLWIWNTRKNSENRYLCPYCAYKSFYMQQLKYHFAKQHIFIQEEVYSPVSAGQGGNNSSNSASVFSRLGPEVSSTSSDGAAPQH